MVFHFPGPLVYVFEFALPLTHFIHFPTELAPSVLLLWGKTFLLHTAAAARRCESNFPECMLFCFSLKGARMRASIFIFCFEFSLARAFDRNALRSQSASQLRLFSFRVNALAKIASFCGARLCEFYLYFI